MRLRTGQYGCAVRLAINVGYGSTDDSVTLAQEADRLGYAVAWAAEAYGSDAVTVLTWIAAKTQRIDVGSAILQIPARTPTMTAMTAATLDTLSGGRFRLGLGLSGPQVSEGWHGVRFAKPLARTREYVDIVKLALSRERVRYDGGTYRLPLPDGPGKALHLMLHPVREHIPLYIASIGPKNLELTGELADGWLAIFFAPKLAGDLLDHLGTGRARAGKTLDGFDVVPSVPLVVGEDLDACAAPVRAYAALYIGGMGSREQNFYNALAARMGFPEEAAAVQDRYLARDYDGAAAAVPAEFVDATSLIGPPSRIADRMAEFGSAGVTTLSIAPFGRTLEDKVRSLSAAMGALERSGAAS
jgi:F420-dependent oxidoreductase-like protein